MDGVHEQRAHADGKSLPWQRDPTGVPHLDELLGGGIPRGTLALIVGPPGSGKTTLAAQMAFAAAKAGRRVLIFTALSEPPSKLIAHLRTFEFFDEQVLGDVLRIISLKSYLDQGLAGVTTLIAAEARQQHASLVLLDGFSGVRDALGSSQAARAIFFDLGATLATMNATTIITSAGTARTTDQFPEMTSADLVVGMHCALQSVREQRGIEMVKVRGAALLPGMHGLKLNAHGIRIYPRLEARVSRDDEARRAQAGPAAAEAVPSVRAAFDLPALDMLLSGGMTPGTSTLVLGSPGVGKTLLGLQFALAGLRAGEPAVMLGFHESGEELQYKAAAFRLDPLLRHALGPGGGLTLLRYPSVERDADVLADALLSAIEATKARRVVVDSLGELTRAITMTSGEERVADYFAALLEALRLRKVTTLLIRETGEVASVHLAHQTEMVSLLAANVMWLQQLAFRGRLHRVLSVPKMRFSAHDLGIREYAIEPPEGLRVLTPEETTSGLLAAISGHDGLAWQEGDTGPGVS